MTTEERIQKEAEEKYKLSGIGDYGTRNGVVKANRKAYIAGATAEAARNKENAIAFLQWWLNQNDYSFPPEQLYDLFIEQNKKV